MKQCESIAELSDALRQADIPAWYMIEADDSFKKDHGISTDEKWHRFFVETDSAPINRWENMPHYTKIAINEALTEIRITEK
ncbi:MAG: hypothetical protein ACYSWO_13055 [Planctomycetota bacterium]